MPTRRPPSNAPPSDGTGEDGHARVDTSTVHDDATSFSVSTFGVILPVLEEKSRPSPARHTGERVRSLSAPTVDYFRTRRRGETSRTLAGTRPQTGTPGTTRKRTRRAPMTGTTVSVPNEPHRANGRGSADVSSRRSVLRPENPNQTVSRAVECRIGRRVRTAVSRAVRKDVLVTWSPSGIGSRFEQRPIVPRNVRCSIYYSS